MSLMLNLGDVINVLRWEGYLKNEDDVECICNALEQKCYSMREPGANDWLKTVIGNIDNVMCPEEIAKHIADGTFVKWLASRREVILAQLELAVRKKAEVAGVPDEEE